MKAKPQPITHIFGLDRVISRTEAANSIRSLRNIGIKMFRTSTGLRFAEYQSNIITTKPKP